MAQISEISGLLGLRKVWFAALLMSLVAPVMGVLLDDFLAAADQGQCIESVTFRVIRDRGPVHAATVMKAALEAYSQRERQQRLLGCTGDIAAQAIAAGADPGQVLEATAAGL